MIIKIVSQFTSFTIHTLYLFSSTPLYFVYVIFVALGFFGKTGVINYFCYFLVIFLLLSSLFLPMFVDMSPYYMNRFLNLRFLKYRAFSPFLIFFATLALLTSVDYVSSVYKVYLFDQELVGMENNISKLEQSNRTDKVVEAKKDLFNKEKDFNIDGPVKQIVKNFPK